ncbi:hypothetical protein VULLAG_LOCUS20205 [Vulpes lagopus]
MAFTSASSSSGGQSALTGSSEQSHEPGSGPAAVRGGVQTLMGKGLCPPASLRQGHTRGQARVFLFPDQPRATGQDPPTLNHLGDGSRQEAGPQPPAARGSVRTPPDPSSLRTQSPGFQEGQDAKGLW